MNSPNNALKRQEVKTVTKFQEERCRRNLVTFKELFTLGLPTKHEE
jgi:hypothetical protein